MISVRIKSDFPVLQRRMNGLPLIYLDSAATSLKPQCVLECERKYSTYYTANIHRGNHLLSDEATEAYEVARRTLAGFLNVSLAQIIFVRSATEAINLVARGMGLARHADCVLAATSEHHSNLVPWMREARVAWIEHDALQPLALDRVKEAIERERPRILTFSYASNVTGVVNPARAICQLARSHGVLTCVDASQAVAHLPIDIADLACDYLAFSGHKMLGPTGIGVLTGRMDALEHLEPLLVGGGAVERVTTDGFTLKGLPHRLEAGTPNIAGAIGLAAAVGYLDDLNWQRIGAHEELLASRMEQAFASLEHCKPIMAHGTSRLALGSVAVQSTNFGPANLARILSDHYGVMVRAGFHCAHPLFDGLGLTNGTVRVSPYVYNEPDEIDYLAKSMKTILMRFAA